MFRIVLALGFIACAAFLSLWVIYTGQPDLVFRQVGERITYATTEGQLAIVFDAHGRVIYRRVRQIAVDAGGDDDDDDESADVSWEGPDDRGRRTRWIKTRRTIRKTVLDRNEIVVFDQTWPRTEDVVDDAVSDHPLPTTPPTAMPTTSIEAPDGPSPLPTRRVIDPFAPENMKLQKSHDDGGGRVVEWYETEAGDYKVKIVRMRGAIIHVQKFPLVTSPPPPAPTPTKAVPPSPRPASPDVQPKPPGETFRRTGIDSEGTGRNRRYVIWYESENFRRKVIKQGGREIFAVNYRRPPTSPSPSPTVRPTPPPSPTPVASPRPATPLAPTSAPPPPPTAKEFDPFAIENMKLTSVEERPGAARVEWYETRAGDFRVKVVREGNKITGTFRYRRQATPEPTAQPSPPPSPLPPSAVATVAPTSPPPVATVGPVPTPAGHADPAGDTLGHSPPPTVSVSWTETETASFKTVSDAQGRVIFRQRFPK